MKTVLLNLLDNGRKAIEGEGTLYLLGRKGGGGTTVGRHAGYLHAVRRKAPASCRNTMQRLYAEL